MEHRSQKSIITGYQPKYRKYCHEYSPVYKNVQPSKKVIHCDAGKPEESEGYNCACLHSAKCINIGV